MSLPSLFVSHGAPDLPLYETAPAVEFLKQLGTQLPRPKAILAVSAHWETRSPAVSIAPQPETIHDFGGFPPETYAFQYPAPGAPELAERVEKLLTQAGMSVTLDPSRGLDHGAWEPLMLMYPAADIPVTQLSVQPRLGTAHHLQLGRAIAPLREDDVLILASGAATHNLRAFGGYAFDAAPPAWVAAFDQWLAAAIAQGDTDALLHYRQVAPHAADNHPSEEHFLPLLVAMGAGGDRGIQLHHSTTYGILSMAAYGFGQ
ncbi:dioxygenase [Thermoleptolyngbya oregonensis NK1-22]|uniref:Dioxygenase n=1 Tax=Thermoleptolyngbya oregonensis NK1-22 TaxID=2547457 RepID=A0AA97B9A2_9CYAN|nr:class III extradiol ring-cleavage dioxygenase [Thermoleptolyngbya oregonensis]WOB42145.1 dioxygenase [Thermoleptolyngbya oregonensis NK1-22]